jgi:hypothetical protein
MQLMLILVLVSFLGGFLTSCEVSYNHYKVKDLKETVASLRDQKAKYEKASKDAEDLNEKAITTNKTGEKILDEVINTPFETEVTVVEPTKPNTPVGPRVWIGPNGMRAIQRLQKP